jgi:hypothetical protein
MFKKRVLRLMLGCNRWDMTGSWRKLYEKEFSDFHLLPDVIGITNRRLR